MALHIYLENITTIYIMMNVLHLLIPIVLFQPHHDKITKLQHPILLV